MEKRTRGVPAKAGPGLQIKVTFEGEVPKELSTSVYAFDREGALLASAPVREGQVRLDLSDAQAGRSRILVGPSLEGKRQPGISALERLHAYEPKVVIDFDKHVVEVLPVPEIYWKWWLWCRCRVRGKVVKPVTVRDVTLDMPVCHARVHVCEVDPIWLLIPRLPDHIIDRLRHELIVAVERPFPWPEPDPPPFRFDPGIVDPSPFNIARMNWVSESTMESSALGKAARVAFDPQPEPPARLAASFEFPGSRLAFNPQPEPPGRPDLTGARASTALNPQPEPPATTLAGVSLSVAAKAALMSPSITAVRQTLLAHSDLIRLYLCYWPWIWPYFYRCDEFAVIETDSQGRFETDIWYLCAGDHPDLYFWVEFSIGGAWTTVYHPPIRCHTYWNYACGSEVVIRLTDPRVPWCGDPPSLIGKQVGVMTIGNNVSLHEIQGAAAGVNEGLTSDGRPFGASLEPHVWFGYEDLKAVGVTHYRWSYRHMDGVDPWHAMDHQVVRHYAVIDPAPPHDLTFKPAIMGPDPAFPTKNLFKIQPTDPPAGSFGWAPMVDARENTASAFFLSHLLEGGDAASAAGKYELKLELFDSSGNRVNLTDLGISFRVPTTDAPFGSTTVPTVAAPAENLVIDAGKVVAFRLVLRVDNNPVQAVILPTNVAGTSAGMCGFIGYHAGDNAHISFLAAHPHNFAVFSFGTYRGSSGIVPAASAAGPVGAPVLNGFVRNAWSVFSKDVPVALLVGGCPGGNAAFAEALDVDATATDGWSHHLWYLDRDATPKAFALTPAP